MARSRIDDIFKHQDMNKIIAVLSVLAIFAPIVAATYGVDVSQATGVFGFDQVAGTWKCLRGQGFSFAVIRCWQSTGHADANCPHTIYNAWDGGMKNVDIYIFPCPRCGNPAGQIRSQVEYLAKYNITSRSKNGPPHSFGMIWLDIEGTQYWGSQHNNVAFIQSMITEAERLGLHVGIYTSASQWGPITGNWAGTSHYPLWYAHYDNSPSFSDFRPFAGWSKPAIKQYAGDKMVCGAGVDKNFY